MSKSLMPIGAIDEAQRLTRKPSADLLSLEHLIERPFAINDAVVYCSQQKMGAKNCQMNSLRPEQLDPHQASR